MLVSTIRSGGRRTPKSCTPAWPRTCGSTWRTRRPTRSLATCTISSRARKCSGRTWWRRGPSGSGRPRAEERVKRHRSDFLAGEDAQGRRVIFYSLRHSCGTAFGSAGIAQKDIAASYHTKTSTTDRYVDADLAAKAKAVNVLPDVSPPEPQVMHANGTEGAPPDRATCSPHCSNEPRKVAIDGGGVEQAQEKTAFPDGKRGSEASAIGLEPATTGRQSSALHAGKSFRIPQRTRACTRRDAKRLSPQAFDRCD